jgi:soluble lytic murein transglycosylase-like protein
MDVASIILTAAKAAHVSGVLLLAICSHESNGFKTNYVEYDRGSPSHGYCQVKLDTAIQLGFHGNPEQLKEPRINAHYAALYLKYQVDRYGDGDWCTITASYNSGSYVESENPGYPKNLNYVRLVQKKLPEDFKDKLSCGNRRY